MTKRRSRNETPKSRGQKGMHVITPTQAEFMMSLRHHRNTDHKGATAEELADDERSEAMVRKLTMLALEGRCPLRCLTNFK